MAIPLDDLKAILHELVPVLTRMGVIDRRTGLLQSLSTIGKMAFLWYMECKSIYQPEGGHDEVYPTRIRD